jgi:hypothetical protein
MKYSKKEKKMKKKDLMKKINWKFSNIIVISILEIFMFGYYRFALNLTKISGLSRLWKLWISKQRVENWWSAKLYYDLFLFKLNTHKISLKFQN